MEASPIFLGEEIMEEEFLPIIDYLHPARGLADSFVFELWPPSLDEADLDHSMTVHVVCSDASHLRFIN